MPKINPINVSIQAVGTNGFQHSYPTEVLSSSGVFRVAIPQDQVAMIREIAERPEHLKVELVTNQAGLPVLQSSELSTVKLLLEEYGRTRVETVSDTELVIFYRSSASTTYCVGPDGGIHPRMHGVEGESLKNPGHGSDRNRLEYSAGITARVVAKTTARFPGGFHITHEDAVLPDDTDGGRLNSFLNVRSPGADFWSQLVEGQRRDPMWDDNPSGLRIYSNTGWQVMAYSEQNAKFFYDMMLNVCRLSERIVSFLGDDPRQLAHAIASLKALPDFTN